MWWELVAVTLLLLKTSLGHRDRCSSYLWCHECLSKPNCAWCSQPEFREPRCFVASSIASSRESCQIEYLVDYYNMARILRNEETRLPTNYLDSVQIRPQHVTLALRPGAPYNLRLEFSASDSYAADVYFLLDTSRSMKGNKELINKLVFQQIERSSIFWATNWRLGVGTFADKEESAPEDVGSSCLECDTPDAFRHRMSLYTSWPDFEWSINSANLSSTNGDGLLDGLYQAAACEDEVGWRRNSLRILVVATDSPFNDPGDNEVHEETLTPYDGLCHMGYPNVQEPPTVDQVNDKLKETGINVIFVVPEEQLGSYHQLAERLDGSSVALLSPDDDSSDVRELMTNMHGSMRSTVELRDTAPNKVKVKYFSDCNGEGPPIETNTCTGFNLRDIIRFTATIELSQCPEKSDNLKLPFVIYPVGIRESVRIDLLIICKCPCEQPYDPAYGANSSACSYSGNLECGVCNCDSSHFGRQCELSTGP